MLFDPEPKTSRSDFFDREVELEKLGNYLRQERLVVIYGVRRVGKTSLMRVALNEAGIPFAYIDVRGIYDSSGNVSEQLFLKGLISAMRSNMPLYDRLKFDVKSALKRIDGIRIRGLDIELSLGAKVDTRDVLRDLDAWCLSNGTRFVLGLDEAQYLRYSKYYPMLIGWIYDNLKGLVIVLAGSEVGLLKDFLESKKSGRPLGGRLKFEIMVDRFSREQSLEFLRRGLDEAGVKYGTHEIEEAVNALDGIAGWLTIYGRYRRAGRDHGESLESTLKEAQAIVADELNRLIYPSKARYMLILRSIAKGMRSWTEIKDYLELKDGPITDSQFNRLLDRLVKFGFVEKTGADRKYSLVDPILDRMLRP